MIEILGVACLVLTIIGSILNSRKVRCCFIFWTAAAVISLIIHISVPIWSLAFKNIMFLGINFYGFSYWKRKSAK